MGLVLSTITKKGKIPRLSRHVFVSTTSHTFSITQAIYISVERCLGIWKIFHIYLFLPFNWHIYILLKGPRWWTRTLHWPCLHCCFHWPTVLHVIILASDTVSIFLDSPKLFIETILFGPQAPLRLNQKTLFIELIYGWYFFNPLKTVLSQPNGKLFQSGKILINVKRVCNYGDMYVIVAFSTSYRECYLLRSLV